MFNARVIVVLLVMTLFRFSASSGFIFHGIATPAGGTHAWVVTIETTAVFHSSNFGYTWNIVAIPTIRDFFDVFFLTPDSGWTCGRAGDIWRTTDGGMTWQRQNLGGPKHASRIRFVDGEFGWAAGGDIVQLRTTNGGEEWQQIFLPVPPFPGGDTAEFHGVWFVDYNHGWLVAGRWPSGDTYQGGQGLIAKTTDGGESWQVVRRDTTYDFYDVYFADYNTGWVVGGDDRNFQPVVLYTNNAGNSWVTQPVPPGARFLRAVKFINRNLGWACGRSGTIIHTSDGGTSWVLQYSGADSTLFDIDFADSLRGMAAGNGVVVVTTDGGVSWTTAPIGIEESADPSRLKQGATLVLSGSVVIRLGAAVLIDVLGRRVCELNVGKNTLDKIVPGVYFVVPKGTKIDAGIMKLVIR